MAIFEVEIDGRVFDVDAADQGSAVAAARKMVGASQSANVASRDPIMGGDGVSGDSIRAAAAGDTRSKMPLPAIQAAYRVAQDRGDRAEQQAMAGAYVDRERAESPIVNGIGDRVRSVARGVPFVGEYLDEANAAIAAPFNRRQREENLDYQRARDRNYDARAPYQSLAGKVVGGVAGTIAAAPAAAATGTGILLGLGARSVPGAIARGATAGVLQGGTAGFGRGEDIGDRTRLAAQDGAVGAAFGGTVPALLALGKAGWDRTAAALAPRDALASVPTKARDWLVRTVGEGGSLQRMNEEAARLGPRGMLADVSPEMLGIAQGAAARPGTRGPIIDALAARDAGKNARLAQAVDENLGRVVEPSRVQAGIRENMDSVGGEYADVMRQNAQRVQTQPIADALDTLAVDLRGPAQRAVRDVRQMLNIPGERQLDPSPNALFQTRQAIDGIVATETNPQAVRQLTMARQMIDDELARAVPGIKQVDARFEELATQRGALDEGSRIFRTGPESMRPADLAERLAGAPQPKGLNVGPSAEPLRISQGARAEIDRIVGSNANDVASMRQLLKGEGDWNRDKLRMVFGSDRADRLMRVLDNEGMMENTYRQVVGGSQTGVKRGFQEFLDATSEGSKVPVESSATGLLARGAQRILQRVTGSNNEARAAEFAEALASLPIRQGDEARGIIDALLRRSARARNDERFIEMSGRAGVGGARLDDTNAAKLGMLGLLMGRDYARNSADRATARQPNR